MYGAGAVVCATCCQGVDGFGALSPRMPGEVEAAGAARAALCAEWWSLRMYRTCAYESHAEAWIH